MVGENPVKIKMDDLGVPPCIETPTYLMKGLQRFQCHPERYDLHEPPSC